MKFELGQRIIDRIRGKDKREKQERLISDKDISVIVQGAIDKNTILCLKSIRKYLPDAEIILSTWENSDVSGLDYDKLVLGKDPGAPEYTRSDGAVTPCNINRQLVSTINGLKVASKYFSLKLRSDLFLSNNNFLKYFSRYQTRDNNYQFFDRKVLISSIYTKKCSHINHMPVCYHPSDWIFLGLTNDLIKYFDIPLADNTNFFNWTYKNPLNNPYPKSNERYYIEQYYFINSFSKKFDLKYYDLTCWSAYSINLWKQLLINNFIVIDNIDLGIYSNKHSYLFNRNNGIDKSFKGLIWSSDYDCLYKSSLKRKVSYDELNSFKKLSFYDFGFNSKIENLKKKINMCVFKIYSKTKIGETYKIRFLGFKITVNQNSPFDGRF